MSKKLKKRLGKIIIGSILFIATILIEYFITGLDSNVYLLAYLLTYMVIGGDVVKRAINNIKHGEIFDENFLMLIATIGAFLISEYPEAVAVMLFYQIGEWFQAYAVGKSRKSITSLMNIRPDYANVTRNGETISVDPTLVKLGEYIVVKPGEKIPLDGCVIKGKSTIDTMALTGESLPRNIDVDDEVISGCINITGLLEIKVTKEFADSTVSKILDLVENASSKKAQTENFITRFAKYYTPIVVGLALLLAIIPSIIFNEPSVWIYRALTFLVVSCPCALVISVPLSFFGGIGGASKEGILIKGSNYLELLANADTVVMDKTGTLTKGIFGVTSIQPVDDNTTKEQLLEFACYAEFQSNHPISKSIVDAYVNSGKQIDKDKIKSVKEVAGFGVIASVDSDVIYAGNKKLLEQNHIDVTFVDEVGTVIYIACNQTYVGYLVIEDEIKLDSEKAIAGFKKNHIKNIVMLTGDSMGVAKKVANKLGIEDFYAGLLPGDKVEQVEKLLENAKGNLVFVGDGINDAPVLARADIGVAMGGLGQDAAIEAADIVIMTDEVSKINTAIHIAKNTMQIVKQNIWFAIGVKVIVLILSALGFANMWLAVFADVGVSFIAILNAMRAMRVVERTSNE